LLIIQMYTKPAAFEGGAGVGVGGIGVGMGAEIGNQLNVHKTSCVTLQSKTRTSSFSGL
jgi:hypothetical protein